MSNPKKPRLVKMTKSCYYILNLTWGIVMTVIGAVVVFPLLALNYNVKKYKTTWYVVVPGNWGGISLGAFFIICQESEYLKTHEFGHTIQNAIFGPFMIFIGLASLIRATCRNIQSNRGKKLGPYESVWYEKQATEWGKKYFN